MGIEEIEKGFNKRVHGGKVVALCGSGVKRENNGKDQKVGK